MSDVHDSLNKKMELEKEFINLIKYDIEENEANKARKEKYSMSRCKKLLEEAAMWNFCLFHNFSQSQQTRTVRGHGRS